MQCKVHEQRNQFFLVLVLPPGCIYDPMKTAALDGFLVSKQTHFTGCVKCKIGVVTFTGWLKHLTVITTVSVE